MKILFSPFSPYVRKCLSVAHELGLHSRLSLLPSNAHPVQRDRAIIADNPLGKVPTFYTDDGLVLFDSRVICEYLNTTAGGTLIPAEGVARWQSLTLQALGDGILDAALIARYEDAVRPEALRWDTWRAAQLDKADTSLAYLDAHPERLDGALDIGQITIACALWYLSLRFPDFAWIERYPKVAAWYATFSNRPSQQHDWQLSE